MNEFYDEQWKEKVPEAELRQAVVQALVQKELKANRYDADYYGDAKPQPYDRGAIVVTAGQAHAFKKLKEFYGQKFGAGGELAGLEQFKPANYITSPQEIEQLSAFFYWGGWLCGAQRPGFAYSYTHNWPYDPLAGNLPHGGLVLWSVIGTLVVILTIGVIFYYYGKMDRESVLEAQKARVPPLATSDLVDEFKPTPTQRATYKFFAVAAVLFLIQISAGLLAISDFVSLFKYLGVEVNELLPVTISRAWHTQISILWIAVCWFAATIWVLPLICRPEPSGQLRWVNTLFWMLVVVAVGGAAGIPLGIKGVLGEGSAWRWIGLQGW
jgi:nitric oxide reductase subunit B